MHQAPPKGYLEVVQISQQLTGMQSEQLQDFVQLCLHNNANAITSSNYQVVTTTFKKWSY